MDKNTKQAKAAKAKAEETALNRVLCWIAGGAVLEFLLLLLDRYWSHYTVAQIDFRMALGTAVKILAVAALACAAAAGFWWNNARRSGKGTTLPGLLGLFLLGVSVGCFAAWFFSSAGLQIMALIVPGIVVLALVYYLYQREFFLIACQCALGLLGVLICSRSVGGSYAAAGYLVLAVAAVLLVASALMCRKVQENDGVWEKKDGKKAQLFPRKANYALLYAGALVTLAVLIAVVIGAAPSILYGVLVAWLLILAVYFTVKMM